MENKYFTPNIENVYVGYELEWKCKIRNQDWEKTICDTDLISIIYDEYEHADFEEPYHEQFRVPYLTKEKIEAEGWISQDETGFFIKGKYELYYNQQWNNDKEFSLQIIEQPDFVFKGFCKDINTFRLIQKLLGIK